jgi:transposase InsO family protein
LNGEIFDTLTEAKVLIERWRQEYNRFRPHSSLGYKPPSPVTKSDLVPETWSSTICMTDPLPKLT